MSDRLIKGGLHRLKASSYETTSARAFNCEGTQASCCRAVSLLNFDHAEIIPTRQGLGTNVGYLNFSSGKFPKGFRSQFHGSRKGTFHKLVPQQHCNLPRENRAVSTTETQRIHIFISLQYKAQLLWLVQNNSLWAGALIHRI